MQKLTSDESVFRTFFVDHFHPGWEEAFVEQFNKTGIVTLEGVRDRASFLALIAELGNLYQHRDSEPDGLTKIASRGVAGQKVGYRAFTSEDMDLHTDRSGVESPPAMLAMRCQQQALSGGESVFVDAKAVFNRCRKYYPSLLEELQRSTAVAFGDPQDAYVGSVFEQRPDLSWNVRFRSDELGFFSPSLAARLPEFQGILAALVVKFRLEQGQAYVASNHRWLHGRSSFVGPREMYRGLLNLHTAGSWASRLRTGFTAD